MVKKVFASKMIVALLVVGLAMPLALSRTAAAGDGLGTAITVNPLGFIGWGPDVELELMISESNALAIRGKFGGWSIGDWKNSTLGGGVAYRWFLQEENYAKGLWVGPMFELLSLTTEFGDNDAVSTMIYSFNFQLGYKWVLGKKVGFVISPYVNLGYNMGDIAVNDIFGVSQTQDFSGVNFGLGMAVGVAF